MDTMTESFRLNFWEQIKSTMTYDIKEASKELHNRQIDLMLIEPKHIGEYNYQDQTMRGQAKAWIEFIKEVKANNVDTKVVVLSDFESGETLDMLWDTRVERIFSKPTGQKRIIESLMEILQIQKI